MHNQIPLCLYLKVRLWRNGGRAWWARLTRDSCSHTRLIDVSYTTTAELYCENASLWYLYSHIASYYLLWTAHKQIVILQTCTLSLQPMLGILNCYEVYTFNIGWKENTDTLCILVWNWRYYFNVRIHTREPMSSSCSRSNYRYPISSLICSSEGIKIETWMLND